MRASQPIQLKCQLCSAQIYEDTLCKVCQFNRLSITEQNLLHEIADAIDLANLKLAVKGIK